ncbi:MAG: 4-(cytidine 5'-diphospho)-2-C-methyl-D-erythritol kinase [Actinomycetia bacterium]|nr:4-(cytidine 5'-diphospho)-2-C-methyl-D-erythritol kinase [Actinomycetes bacterium]
MVTLDLHDQLTVCPRRVEADSEVRYLGLVPTIASIEHDLVAKALRLVGRVAEVTVTKRIPEGAGLGGGSADAAAILRWAGFDDLEQAAFELGADVAFCLIGGRARVSGMGEVVTPLPFEAKTVTLLTPPVHCPTAEVYRAWDNLSERRVPGDNDLELAALEVRPELGRWRHELAEATGCQPQLAGSGSTWFVYGAHPGAGRVVANTVPAIR